jgi:ABC-type nitrate/sulfonate/bicarbonate transport system substrate-binding protein
MSEKLWTRRGVLASGAALGAAGVWGVPARAAEKVSFITPYGKIIAYAPDFVGAAGGYFAKAGIDVDIIGGHGSAQAVQLVAAGKALVGRTGGIDVVKAIATSNVPVRAIATIAHLSPFWVISSAAKPIDNPKQMAGKTIGVVSRGGGTDNYLDIMLTVSGLSKDAVKRQVSGNSPGAFDLVELGRLDGFIADETVLIMLRRAGKKVKAWRVDDYASIPGQVYIASNEGISAHKDALIAYLKGVHEAIEFIVAPDHMDKVMDEMKGFDLQELRQPDVAKLSVEAQAKLWLAAGPQNVLRNMPEKWAKGWKEMADAGLVKMGDPKTAYTNELVKAAL